MGWFLGSTARHALGSAAVAITAAALALAALATVPAAAAAPPWSDGTARDVSAAQAADLDTWFPAGAVDHRATGEVHRGLRLTDACAGGFAVEDSAGACTHGPDPAPAGVDVRDVPTVAELRDQAAAGTGAAETAAAAGAVPCYGDGVSGKRVQVIYAVASDRADRYASVVDLIRGYAWNADQAYYLSAQRNGGVRHLRWLTDSSCRLDVAHVVLSPTGDDTIGNTRTELRNLGYTSNDRKYVVFADAAVYCGISYTVGDARPDATNPANSGGTVSRIDSSCWGGTTSVPAHEIAHGLGAVQLSAPHSNGAWHCTDEYDRLCYNDGSGAALTYLCASSQEPLLDCNGDDYFNVAPAAGSWLSTHWNLASSAFLETVEPGAPSATATPTPTPTPTATPTSTPSVTPTLTPTPTATVTTAAPVPVPIATQTVAIPTPVVTPTPTTTTTAAPTRRVATRWRGRLTAADRVVTYRFTAGRGPLSVTLLFTDVRRMRVTVLNRAGQSILSRRGTPTLSALTTVAAGTYRLRITGPAGAHYTVSVLRTAR